MFGYQESYKRILTFLFCVSFFWKSDYLYMEVVMMVYMVFEGSEGSDCERVRVAGGGFQDKRV